MYDLLGLSNPIVFMQNLWKTHLRWDEEIPSKMCLNWNKFISELACLANLRSNCYVNISTKSLCIIVGSSDASKRVCCGTVYLII